VPEKVVKKYPHIPQLKERAMNLRLADPEPLHRHKELSLADPRRISKHLAPVSPPPTSQIVASKKSRFV
jgi:hypothetical protein